MDERQQEKQLSLHLTLGGKGEALKPEEGSLIASTANQCAESLVDDNQQLDLSVLLICNRLNLTNRLGT